MSKRRSIRWLRGCGVSIFAASIFTASTFRRRSSRRRSSRRRPCQGGGWLDGLNLSGIGRRRLQRPLRSHAADVEQPFRRVVAQVQQVRTDAEQAAQQVDRAGAGQAFRLGRRPLAGFGVDFDPHRPQTRSGERLAGGAVRRRRSAGQDREASVSSASARCEITVWPAGSGAAPAGAKSGPAGRRSSPSRGSLSTRTPRAARKSRIASTSRARTAISVSTGAGRSSGVAGISSSALTLCFRLGFRFRHRLDPVLADIDGEDHGDDDEDEQHPGHQIGHGGVIAFILGEFVG